MSDLHFKNGQSVLYPADAFKELPAHIEGRPFFVTDENVSSLYKDRIEDVLKTKDGYTMSAGEASKTPETLLRILEKIKEENLTRADTLVAVGGGVVGDVAGLAAALYMRGMHFLYVPTTLLADVDAAIGGKNAVDFCGVKNLLGTFYFPDHVLIDPAFLHTLPRRELRCGLGEIVKHAALCEGLFDKLIVQKDLFDLEFLSSLIPQNIAIKRRFFEADPFDRGLRRALNLGHTTAHAIELAGTNLSHGECVLFGILVEAELAKRHCAADEVYLDELKALSYRILQKTAPDIDLSLAARLARFDKKNGENIVCICPKARGEFVRLELTPDEYERELLAIGGAP